ncbi:hypothetical protein L4D09_28605 [Photobacterium makurazakiensis]|uniref:hypothetical protein n=1 Tax=Photobacterium makurazakiensis TaxID=2910234 RepID=UPI003D0BED20
MAKPLGLASNFHVNNNTILTQRWQCNPLKLKVNYCRHNDLVNDKLITIRHQTIVAAREPENNNAGVQKEACDAQH